MGWLCQGLTKTELAVLLVLSSRANEAGCWTLSRDLIAQEAGLRADVRRVTRALRKLESRGALIVDHQRRGVSRYWPQPAPTIEALAESKGGQFDQGHAFVKGGQNGQAREDGRIAHSDRGIFDQTKIPVQIPESNDR